MAQQRSSDWENQIRKIDKNMTSMDQPTLVANNFQHGAPIDARLDPMEITLRDLYVNSKNNKAGVKQASKSMCKVSASK